MPKYITSSIDILRQVKLEQPYQNQMSSLAAGTLEQLDMELDTDKKKAVFWINCYNAYFLILRRDQQLNRPAIYRARKVLIAGQKFSLDDIEHGILRRYRSKISLGYLPSLFTPNHIKALAVEHLDHRIHFALNCGAKSCPPILSYKIALYDQQISVATENFIINESVLDPIKKTLKISKLFLWYQADFGGKTGTRTLLQKVLGQDLKGYKISYADYNWEEDLSNWA